MKRTPLAAVAAVLLLALAGCAGAAETPAEGTTAPETTESAAPLTAETPTEAPTDDVEATYLEQVRAELPANTQIPDATDQQLLDAGHAACEAVAAGTPTDQISVIEGETPNGLGYYDDSGIIVGATAKTLCPR